MDTLTILFAWLRDHPEQAVEYLLALWTVANVVWAQWPKPHSERGQKIWRAAHSVFLLVATHSSVPGTFTWPVFLRSIIQSLLNTPMPDPFGPKPPAVAGKKVEPGDE